MRSGVAGPTPVKDCASQQLRQLGDIRRDPQRLATLGRLNQAAQSITR
jgi:phage host-nuclease inhibitor protein Gam